MFTQLRPVLFVDDLPAEVDFYQKFGFQILFHEAEFVGLICGQQILFGLQHRPGAKFTADQPVIWQIATDDMDEVYHLSQQECIPVLREPELQSWGEWIMTVLSPNGYHVVFEGDKKNHI
jgi:catechol 2,3-dioxygenase-like lactoylglutathione lyase family enzyme